jgi:glycosyltransferase involved in cell wall biosynthesis
VRIAMVSTPFVRVPPTGYGGTELVVGTLVEGLVARGHEVVLFASGDSQVPARVRSLYPSAAWPPDPWRELAHACFSARAIREDGGFDLVHSHVPAFAACVPGLEAPVVGTIHHGPDGTLGELYRAVGHDALRWVALTERHAEVLGRDLVTEVIGHGLPAARYPLGPGGDAAVFLGRFAAEKGPHDAIEAARRAGVPLRMAGRVHEVDTVWADRVLAPLLGTPGVTVLGEVDLPRKVALLGSALALLFPVAWEEPFGLVMIEAMLCGTPVIAYDRGSVREIVDEGVTGFVVSDAAEMAVALRALQREGFDRARCRTRAARRFGSLRMVDRYLRLYRDVASHVAPPRLAAVPS